MLQFVGQKLHFLLFLQKMEFLTVTSKIGWFLRIISKNP